jgi:thymidylate kinase
MLCSTDRLEWSVNDYPKLKKNFDLIFVDRHTTSALVYAQIDGLDKEEILFNDRRIVKPDINIILFAPIDVLLKRLEKRNASKELYEKREIMEKALEKYLELYKYYPNVDYINADCTIEKVKNQAIQIINKKLEEKYG